MEILVPLLLCISVTGSLAMPRHQYELKNEFAPRNRFDLKYSSYKSGVVPYLNKRDDPVAIPLDRLGFKPTLGRFNKPVAIPLEIAGFKPTFRHQYIDFPARSVYGRKQRLGMSSHNTDSYQSPINYFPYIMEGEQGRSFSAYSLMMAANGNGMAPYYAMNEGEPSDVFTMMAYLNRNTGDSLLPFIMSDVIEQFS